MKYCKDGWRTGWSGGKEDEALRGRQNGLENKSGNGEMAKKRKKKKEGEGENMGPVVVEMSATGAAEMERAA